jgi:hypothetical protein
MQANVISTPSCTFTATAFNRPFGNNFVAQTAVPSPFRKNEIEAIVTCTQNSKEPGRVYYCIYNTAGTLVSCNTLN